MPNNKNYVQISKLSVLIDLQLWENMLLYNLGELTHKMSSLPTRPVNSKKLDKADRLVYL